MLGLVAENSIAYVNQVKLLLFSLRKNGGIYKDIPVVLISNDKPFSQKHKDELSVYSPITFKTMPRLKGTPHTSKYNLLSLTKEPILYMDCDTVVLRPLDDIFEDYDIICRRGGKSDREAFINFDALVRKYGVGPKIKYNGKMEWPMFNTGVFIIKPDAARKIHKDVIDISYQLYKHWKWRTFVEDVSPLRRFAQSKKQVLYSWPIDQGALALACIKHGLKIKYLDEKYNSWGNLKNTHILHCFKSAYKFNRETMFTDTSWLEEYKKSDVYGKRELAKLVEEYKKEIKKITP